MITKESKIMDVVRQYPQAAEIFERFGMGCIGCMGMANETIEIGAKMHQISIVRLLEELNKLAMLDKTEE